MTRPGPGFPIWSFTGFWLGLIVGFVVGFALVEHWRVLDREWRLGVPVFCASVNAMGGVIVGGIRDVLAYVHRRDESADGPAIDYREEPFGQLPPAPPTR